jgi:hypothetical protein
MSQFASSGLVVWSTLDRLSELLGPSRLAGRILAVVVSTVSVILATLLWRSRTLKGPWWSHKTLG